MRATLRVLVLLCAAAGCGSPSGGGDVDTDGGDSNVDDSNVGGSCDTRSVNNACQEYQATPDVVATYKSACTQGTWKDGACDRSGTVGGCRSTAAEATITNWFFAPQTTESIKGACVQPDQYLAP